MHLCTKKLPNMHGKDIVFNQKFKIHYNLLVFNLVFKEKYLIYKFIIHNIIKLVAVSVVRK